MNKLLIEIGTEEIPAGYIQPALSFFSSFLLKKLSENRIEHGNMQVFGTPRRLAVMVEDVANHQQPLSNELMGPPERIGFDEKGSPTVSALKFAEKSGVPVSQIKVKETGKGRYLCVQKTEPGLHSIKILEKVLPDVILSIPFPKSMHWSDLRIQFARPIHSICALLGKKVVSFPLGNIQSGRYTFGHRFLQPGKKKLAASEEYLDVLSSANVIADIDRRKTTLKNQMAEAVLSVGGKILPDDELVDIVVNLVEYPVTVVGKFDDKFLDLPQEILITAMREHQKYFAVVDPDSKIKPNFIAINNTIARDMKLVAAGHERVLRARLEDAQFFYKTDARVSLDEMAEKLKTVMFQAELGSVYDKTVRVKMLALKLADLLKLDAAQKERIARTAMLCKADLVSHVVGEFPKLQGIMGKVYALLAKEHDKVAVAIEEHYRPTSSGAILPETIEGAVVSIADKIDSICGFFSIGLVPTGAADPHGLRRQGIGVIQIILDKKFAFSLKNLIDASVLLFDKKQDDLSGKIFDFIKGRMAHLLEDAKISKDAVSAVLSVSAEKVVDVWKRAHALQQLKAQPDFQVLAIAFKRVVNIIKKADPKDTSAVQVDTSLFEHPSEAALYEHFMIVKQTVLNLLQVGDIGQSFKQIASLRPFVDQFFDEVLVMTEVSDLRKNRLGLLGQISGLFESLADFSKIST